MNEIQRLIHEMCPNGVPMVALGEVCSIINGRAYKQSELLDKGKYRILRVGNFFSNDSWYYSDLELEDKYYCEKDDLLYAWSASFGPHIWKEEKVIYHYHIWKIDCFKSIDKYYLYYWLQSTKMSSQVSSEIHGATMAHLTKALMERLIIPLPPLPIQQRIVEILDKFTSLVSSLDSEIALRQKQYEYYRNKLLSFEEGDEGVEWKKLGEVCDTLSGFPFDSSKFTNEGIRLMRGMNIKRGYLDFSEDLNRYWPTSQNLEKYLLEDNDIVMSMDGSLVGKSFATIEKKHLPLILVQRVARIRSTKIDTHYVYQCIKYNFSDYVDKKKTGGAIPHISMKDIDNFIIPFPPLDRQLSIVRTLDTFESLLTNLKKERELRQKQYEYYREKLLTFA